MPKATETLSMHDAIIQMRARLAQAAAVADLVVFHMKNSDAPMAASFDRVSSAIDATKAIAVEAVGLIDIAAGVMADHSNAYPKLRLIAR